MFTTEHKPNKNSQVFYGRRKIGITTNRSGLNNRQKVTQPEQAINDSHWISQEQRCNIGEHEVEGIGGRIGRSQAHKRT